VLNNLSTRTTLPLLLGGVMLEEEYRLWRSCNFLKSFVTISLLSKDPLQYFILKQISHSFKTHGLANSTPLCLKLYFSDVPQQVK
jgi:hypothetical protein